MQSDAFNIPEPLPGHELPVGHQQTGSIQEKSGEIFFPRVSTKKGLASASHKGNSESSLCMRKQKSKSF